MVTKKYVSNLQFEAPSFVRSVWSTRLLIHVINTVSIVNYYNREHGFRVFISAKLLIKVVYNLSVFNYYDREMILKVLHVNYNRDSNIECLEWT